MGRARKPLEMQQGHLTVEQQKQMELSEQLVTVGREHLKKPPKWLVDKAAKDEFMRVVKEFDKVNVVGNLDLNNIAGYCNAYALYVSATGKVKATPLTVEKEDETGEIIAKINPLYQNLSKIQRDYAEEMRKFAALCGLTIDSRLKVGTAQISKKDTEIESEFGDI